VREDESGDSKIVTMMILPCVIGVESEVDALNYLESTVTAALEK